MLAAQGLAGMTELEEQLRGPQGRHVCDSAVARLRRLSSDVEAAAARGLPTAEYAAAQDLLKGIAAAQALLTAFPIVEEKET
jgi:hypothetical protein